MTMQRFTDTDETIRLGAWKATVTLEHDHDHGAPWDEEDGHGPVSDWTSRSKRPGELVLNEDHGSTRYYDYQEACRIARRDEWGPPMHSQTIERGSNGLRRLRSEWFIDGELHVHHTDWTNELDHSDYRAAHAAMRATYPSARAYAAAAARADYERLAAWCNNRWSYVGCIVTLTDANGDELAQHSLWGIESDAGDYLIEVANELLDQCISEARETLAKAWPQRRLKLHADMMRDTLCRIASIANARGIDDIADIALAAI